MSANISGYSWQSYSWMESIRRSNPNALSVNYKSGRGLAVECLPRHGKQGALGSEPSVRIL